MSTETKNNATITREMFDDSLLSWEEIGFLLFLLSDYSDNHELSLRERELLNVLVNTGYAEKIDDGSFNVFDEKQV